MRPLWRAAALFFLVLFLVSTSFADGEKTPRKNNDSSASSPDDAVAKPAKDSPKEQPAPPVATPAPQTSKGAKPASAASRGDDSEAPPKWLPMPAWDGNPGLFTLETGEILPKGGFDFTAGANKFSRMPGDVTVLQVGPAFGYGINRWLSVFIQIDAHEHIHVDQPSLLSLNPVNSFNPQFGNTIYPSILPATGFPPAYVEDFPFASVNGGGVGEIDLGFKIGLWSERRGKPISLSIRNDFYIPTRTGLVNLLNNEVQYGKFNYGIGVEASKTIMHRAMTITFNWAYRFTRDSSFNINPGGTPEIVTLTLADQMRVGAGMLVFPDKRFNIISEYNGLIFVGSGIQNTTFGARDPVESLTGFRVYPWRKVSLDVGYRYTLNLTNHQDRNGFIAKLNFALWPEKPREPDTLTSTCAVDNSSVMEGSNAIVQASTTATDAYGHPLSYSWTATGGNIAGAGPYARWDSTGVGPGTYSLVSHVNDGAGKTTSCSATVTVQPKPAPPPPRMSCSADRSSVMVGERAQITAAVNDSTGTPLNYGWRTNGGQIVGSGPTVQLDTSGLAPGSYTVTGRVENGAGGAADCSTAVAVQAPPPPPQASKIGECAFAPNSARADNVCKRVLDDLAIRLQSEPKGRAVLVGTADPKEMRAAKLGAQRGESAKKYLESKTGVDASRVEVRTGVASAGAGRQNRRLDVVWVPDGATY